MGEQLKKKEIEELYKDAFHHHLSREDISDYRNEVEMRRRKARYDEIKSC
jgi:hypothetical protein